LAEILGPDTTARKRRPASVRQQNIIFAHPDISDGAKILAVALLNFQALDLGACVMSRADIGRRLARSEASVKRHLAELRATGWLIETPRPGRSPLRQIVLRPRLVGRRSDPGGGAGMTRQKIRLEGGRKLAAPRWARKVQAEALVERERRCDAEGGVAL